MADQQQLQRLQNDVYLWNRWRAKHPEVRLNLSNAELKLARLSDADLSDADLSGADLSAANLSGANLSGANLSRANLSGTNLSRANLSGAFLISVDFSNSNLSKSNFSNADLSDANLSDAFLISVDFSNSNLSKSNFSDADLSDANLSGADLRDADLSGADLSDANLSDANLSSANLNRVFLDNTFFGDRDFRPIKGLKTIRHKGPSPLGINSFYLSEGDIPEVFVRGTGVPDSFIEYMHILVAKPINYYTCFISYSSLDQDFAEQLYSDLQQKGVRCWFAPEDLKIGDKFRTRIDESILGHDKLLLVLSKHSVNSPWVEKEVEAAFEKENRNKSLVLFPIKLDETVMHTDQAWAADIRRMRHIGDLTRWKEHDAYQRGLQRLLRDLKQEKA